jgi:2-(1,2-epoxy-1,2-dihydrophenyl)acetyl-CoA isomerase
MYQHLIYDEQNGICRITLNRPEVFHALSPELINEITLAFREAEASPSVRVVVLTGNGEKAFCSGADLKAGLQAENAGDALRKRYNPMILGMRNLAKPIICRLNGMAAGAGCSLALACDVIVSADTAQLTELFIGIGLMPDAGSTFFLPRMVGSHRAFELCSTGRKISAQEAFDIGLVNKVVPAATLDQAVDSLAMYYAQAPTQAIGYMKKVINQSFYCNLEEMLELEAVHQGELSQSHDFAEGVLAFLQKRKANFKGC